MASRPQNRLCSVCRREPSSLYCGCSQAAVYLCDSCFIPHKNKSPRLVHTTVPMEVTDMSQYQQRCALFAQGREELLQNIARIDECCAEVSAAVETLMSRAQRYRDEMIERLQEWKRQLSQAIDESIVEAEASLDKEDVPLQAPFSLALRNFLPGSLSFFSFRFPANTTDAFLQSLVCIQYSQAESTAQTGEHTIFWVRETNLKWFDASTGHMSPRVSLQSPIKYDGNSRWATWDASRVALCGGGVDDDAWKSAYVLNTAGGVQQLPDMAFGRQSMGVIVWKAALHVFGSHNGHGKRKCERLNLSSCTRWDSLPDMLHRRSCFTPAAWREAVYLCGYGSRKVEAFDGRCMRLLDVQVPEESNTLACAQGDSLFLLTEHYLTVIIHPANADAVTAVPKKHPHCWVHTRGRLVLWKDALFTLDDAKIRRFSAEDGHLLPDDPH